MENSILKAAKEALDYVKTGRGPVIIHKDNIMKCGLCGQEFEKNRSYGFYCLNSDCPITLKAK